MTGKTSAPHDGRPPGNLRRPTFIGAVILLIVLAVVPLWWLARHPTDTQTVDPVEGAAAALTVTDAAVSRVEWPVQLDASGAIAPWQEAIIGVQVGGIRLTEILVGPGDTVHRGQVLARFETEFLHTDVAQLHAAFRQAKAQAKQAISNRDRALQLKTDGGMSQQEVSQAVTHAETAVAQVELSQAQLDARKLQLGYATVLSPDDGVISDRSATIGSVSTVGEELFRLIRQHRLEWRGELTASQLNQVEQGQWVTLELPDGQIAKAKVRQMAPSLDPQTRLAMVYADIIPGSTARAGMYAQGRIVVAQEHAEVVPASSVVIRDGRSHVFRLTTQEGVMKASLQAVKVGRRQAQDVEILQGLTDGDRVLVQGAGFLNDGDRVRVVKAPDIVIPTAATAQRASQ
ncbi:efflux RND transporter periplasmic adaptor subunit [Pseudomonas sp. RA_15y_Pfl2_54]|uniref:efflux RND transporter periplasmic adaptor subunit n=1 Tax=Pseudomonas sp. RA_15y_Pfl2_54 TaxID=3088704 RepID=UPI0030D6D65A